MSSNQNRAVMRSVSVSLLLMVLSPSNIEAFSSAPSHSLARRRASHSTSSSINAATLDQTDPPINSSIYPSATHDINFSEPSLSSQVNAVTSTPNETTMPPTVDTIQSRSFNKDAIINISVVLLAVGIVLERIFSVDAGITNGLSAPEIAEHIALANWQSYQNVLTVAPLQIGAVTSATVYTIGDIIAQRKEGNDIGEIDRWRTFRSLAAGLIGHGPMCYVWYHVSEDFFDNVLHLHAWWAFLPKVAVDQIFFSPIWNNSYILLLGMMQLQKPSEILSDMKRTTIPLVISGLKLWPFVHCITYGLIPEQNRLLWVDAVEILWVTILASQASGNTEEDNVRYQDGEAIDAVKLDEIVLR